MFQRLHASDLMPGHCLRAVYYVMFTTQQRQFLVCLPYSMTAVYLHIYQDRLAPACHALATHGWPRPDIVSLCS